MEGILVLAGAAALVGVLLLYQRISRLDTQREAMQGVRRCRIADVRAGTIVRLVGQVEALGPLVEGPVTLRRCVAFDGWMSVLVFGGLGLRPTEAKRETGCADFVLRDESGQAVVHPRAFQLQLVQDRSWEPPEQEGGLPPEAPYVGLDDFAARYGHRSSHGIKLQYQCGEGILDVGAQAVVCGLAQWEADPTSSSPYRDSARRLVIRPIPRGAVWISNEPELIALP